MDSNQTRLDEIEEAFMLFAAIISGEPTDATEEERLSAQTRYAELMKRMGARFITRKESKF